MPSSFKRSQTKPRIFCGEVTPEAPAILALWQQHFDGDTEATAKLLEHFAPLAWRSAGRCKCVSPELFIDSIDVLAADGLIGVYRAIRSARHCDGFLTLALRSAKHQIKRSQRQRRGFTVRGDEEKLSIARRMRTEAVVQLGLVPSECEVAGRLAALVTNPGIVIEYKRPQTMQLSSLASARDGETFDVADLHVEQPDAPAMRRETIELAMKGLKGTDRAILSMLLEGFGPTEIAAKVGISRQRVHQRLNGVLWEARTRADLAKHLDAEPAHAPAIDPHPMQSQTIKQRRAAG